MCCMIMLLKNFLWKKFLIYVLCCLNLIGIGCMVFFLFGQLFIERCFFFFIEVVGRCLWFEFDGVVNNSFYWLNGLLIGSQYSGYICMWFDIIDKVRFGGDNVIVVQVDLWYEGWWYEGGGIYCYVCFILIDLVYVVLDGVFVVLIVSDLGQGVEVNVIVCVSICFVNISVLLVDVMVLSEIFDIDGKMFSGSFLVQMFFVGVVVEFVYLIDFI